MTNLVLFRNLTGSKVVSWSSKLWVPSDPEIVRFIDQRWKEMLEKARESGYDLTNGTCVRANSMRIEDGVLLIEAQKTDYRTHATTRDQKDIPEQKRGLALYVAANIVSSDGFLIMGESTTEVTSYITTRNVVAGGVEPEDIEVGRGLEKTLYREMGEEIGLTPEDLKSLDASYVIREKVAVHPSLIYIAHSNLTKDKIKERHRVHNKTLRRGEFSEIYSLPFDKKAIREELEENSNKYQNRVCILLEELANSI